MSTVPHEHDDEGNCIEPETGFYAIALPNWRFSLWDIAGIAATGVGGVFSVAGQALNLVARECSAMANWKRQEYDLQQAEAQRHEVAETLRALVEGDGE